MSKDTKEPENKDNILNQTFFNKYHCISKIGEGSFGNIYKASCNGKYYALKFENIKKSNLLEKEAVIMDYLKGPNLPYIKFYGSTKDYNILVMQLLGKNLETFFEEKKKFSLKTVCMIGFQFVSILEYLHNKHIIHRDIKPDNFVVGLDNLSHNIYILDFGLSKKYRSSKTLKHIPFNNIEKIIGTVRYNSINANEGFEQSRRDDLESAGYVLIYFIKGELPWQGLTANNKEEKYRKILRMKNKITAKELCKGIPKEFAEFVDYTRNLQYSEQPNYDRLKNLFISMLNRLNYTFDYVYDWTTPEEKIMRANLFSKNYVDISSTNYEEHLQNKNKRSISLAFENNNSDMLLTANNKNNSNDSEKNEHINDNEEAIIFSKRNDYLETIVTENEDVCCTSGCKIF